MYYDDIEIAIRLVGQCVLHIFLNYVRRFSMDLQVWHPAEIRSHRHQH